MDQGIGALVRARQLSRPAGPTLQRLSLGGTVMSAVWEHVSRLTTLQALEPASWRADLAAGCGSGGEAATSSSPQWDRLANFSQLQRFDLRPYRHEGLTSRTPLRSEMFLPPLPRLASLVLLDRCRITEQEAEPLNQEMLARMPSLSGARLTQNLLSPSVTGQSWFRRYCQPALQ